MTTSTLTDSDYLEYVEALRTWTKPNVETSTRCTLHCPQCTRKSLDLDKSSNQYKTIKARIANGDDLTLDNAKKLFDFFGAGMMLCGSLSDPVWWKNLLPFLKLSAEYPACKIQVHTAASQRDLEWYLTAFTHCGPNVSWHFGVDGLADTSPIYRVGQNTPLLLQAMILAASVGLTVKWHYIVFDHNVHQIEQATALAALYQVELVLIKSDRVGGGVTVPIEWKPKRNKELLDENQRCSDI